MSLIKSSSISSDLSKITTSKQYRYLVSLAALVLISLLSSWSGSPVQHSISSLWEGFIWGIADPVLNLNRFAGIVAIGLISARFLSGVWLGIAFASAAFVGQIIHLQQFSLPGADLMIAICTIGFGMMLVTSTQMNWLAITFLTLMVGLFQGEANMAAIITADTATILAHVIGVTLTQVLIFLSVREIGASQGMAEVNQFLPRIIRFAGLACCAIGFVFLGTSPG
jgi:urease accessory protein